MLRRPNSGGNVSKSLRLEFTVASSDVGGSHKNNTAVDDMSATDKCGYRLIRFKLLNHPLIQGNEDNFAQHAQQILKHCQLVHKRLNLLIS